MHFQDLQIKHLIYASLSDNIGVWVGQWTPISGSFHFTDDNGAHGNSPSRVIYNQYRQLVYGDETSDFTFDGVTPDDIFVININRARYKHNLKPGTLNLLLQSQSTSVGAPSSSLHLTDDSVTLSGSATITNAGRQFNIVSGSSGVMASALLTDTTGFGSYGYFYPDSDPHQTNKYIDHAIVQIPDNIPYERQDIITHEIEIWTRHSCWQFACFSLPS